MKLRITNERKSWEREGRETGKRAQGPKLPRKRQKKIKEITFEKPFDTLEELITLGESYDPSNIYCCNLDLRKLKNLSVPLTELNNMVGLEVFKKNFVNQVVYLLTLDMQTDKPMLHTCLFSGPGQGKSHLAKILAKIYTEFGYTGKFVMAGREDLVAGFSGQTAEKTRKVLETALGGVLFLDEVYSLYTGREDEYGIEAINTINTFLLENYDKFVCIIAGYEEEVKRNFFSINPGLDRRFPFKYSIPSYTASNLSSIFQIFLKNDNYLLYSSSDPENNSKEYLDNFFKDNFSSFPFAGGDVKTLWDKCKICQARRRITVDKSQWKIILMEDIQNGFKLYLTERQINPLHDNQSHLNMFL